MLSGILDPSLLQLSVVRESWLLYSVCRAELPFGMEPHPGIGHGPSRRRWSVEKIGKGCEVTPV